MHQILRIDGTRSCALIEFERGQIPLWRHYGARLPQTPLLTQWSAPAVKRLPQATMDRMDGIALLPGFGNGFHFSPALRAHQDGRYGIQELVATGFERHDTANHDVLVLILRDATTDPAAQLEVRLTLRMHRDSDVLSMDTQLCNLGLRTLQVDRITSGTLTLGSGLSDVGYFTGQWASEFEW